MVDATKKQLFALYLGTGKCLELRNMCLSLEEASGLISRMKKGEDVTTDLLNLGAETKSPVKRKVDKKGTFPVPIDFAAIYEAADKAGKEAVSKATIKPMVVSAHANMMDDNSDVVESYFVADGPCGFASINFPANTSWARWCKKNNIGSKRIGTGYYIWVSDYNQSMQKKETYARAFSKVLNDNNIKSYYTSQMD